MINVTVSIIFSSVIFIPLRLSNYKIVLYTLSGLLLYYTLFVFLLFTIVSSILSSFFRQKSRTHNLIYSSAKPSGKRNHRRGAHKLRHPKMGVEKGWPADDVRRVLLQMTRSS